ncbi:MAG TPA: 2-amino-4-hydroxy-6-hydroxymethyldihydropteridine diphosphokinase [Candidatus Angelobacter sp.]|nr:2-amino-4-hydroxy-6-hydroxymethyldihydropteridine diphosphokinase [Candidatus Angelobacter sp.]
MNFQTANTLAVIALGSNLGDSRQILLDATERLRGFSEFPVLISSLWVSSPVDCPPGSPKFVNAVVAFHPRVTETPESLLKKLQSLEKEFGRRPKQIMNEPRPLDLDLVVFGRQILQSPELILPHPRAHQRKFVLCPLNEVAPDLVLPGQGKRVSELLADLRSDEQTVRLIQ